MTKTTKFLLPTAVTVLFLGGLAVLVSRHEGEPDSPTLRDAARPGAPVRAIGTISESQFRQMIGSPSTRLQAVVQAGVQRMPLSIVMLKHYAVSDPDARFRAACVRSLGQIGDPESALALVSAAQDPEPAVQKAAIEALGLVFDPACEKELTRLARHEDVEVRAAAVKALSRFHGENASAALVRSLADPNEPARVTAITELAQRKDPQAREGLARGLRDASVAVREAASRALADETTADDWPALALAALDSEKAVREPALRALSRLGPATVKFIEKALTTGPATRQSPAAATLPAREDVARLLMSFGEPDTVPALVRCLDTIPFDKEPPKDAVALRTLIVEHLAAMGSKALEALAAGGIRARVDLFAKEGVAEVCLKLGKAAARPIEAHILNRALFPNASELKVWVKTLGELGEPESAAALNRALAQDVPGIGELVEAARRQIEAKSGAKLPPAAPDAGAAASVKAISIKRGLPPDHATPPKTQAVALPDDVLVVLHLKEALIRPDNLAAKKDLTINLVRKDGRWEREASASARTYNQSFHTGAVTPVDAMRLRVEMAVGDDPWVTGGFGEYEITLEAGAEGLTGHYQGKYNYRNVSGPVACEVNLLPGRYESVPMVESGEHPRLIFRKGEIPAMRQRAQTEIGRAIVRTIRDRADSIGCGFLYALYGDESMGRRAVPALLQSARNPGGAHPHDKAYKLIDAALGYDLVYDCLTNDERTEVTNYLASNAGIVVQTTGLTGNFSNGPNSNWTAIGVGGAGLASLAVLREKGPPSVIQPLEVQPAFEFEAETEAAPAGVPINAYASGAILKEWLLAGPVDGAGQADLLGPLGGPEKARPTAETRIAVPGGSLRFAPMPATAVKEVAGFSKKPHKLVLPATTAKSRSLLYGLLKVDEEAGTRVEIAFPFGFEGAELWIDGHQVPNGSTAIFKPGFHRLLLDVRGAVVCPVLYKVDAHMQVGLYRRYLVLKERYETRRKRHEETGERQDVSIKLDIAKKVMVNWWRLSIGDHGWGTESGYAHAHSCLLPFTVSYETVTGERVIPGTGVPWLHPLVAAVTTASGHPHFTSVKGGPPGMLMHVMAPEVQPAMLMPFQPNVMDETLKHMSCKELAYLFVNYPLDVAPKPAEQVMPKVIADRRKGGYVFRKSYDKGVDDILGAIFLRSDPPRGPAWFYPESGTFAIAGLGTLWADALPGGKRDPAYATECVVLVPPSNGAGAGKAVYFEPMPDGSGVLGADMSAVYRGGPSKVQAMRHFAADYSGASGAPALFALVDRIQGGDEKIWAMHSKGRSVAVSGGGFTIEGKVAGTSMRGAFVPADGLAVSTGSITWRMKNPEYGKMAKVPKVVLDVDIDKKVIPEYFDEQLGGPNTLKAVAKSAQADFFVVMTIQRGPAPQIAVEGRGIQAKVKVGKRTVRFDAERERLILE